MDFLNIKLSAIDENGQEKEFSLSDFKGQKVVLYFYPKDNTSGCTQEACDFRDNFNRLTSKAVVIGVSPDSIKSHLKFKENHSLNFMLLSDPEHKLSEYDLKEYARLGDAHGVKNPCTAENISALSVRLSYLMKMAKSKKSGAKLKLKGMLMKFLKI